MMEALQTDSFCSTLPVTRDSMWRYDVHNHLTPDYLCLLPPQQLSPSDSGPSSPWAVDPLAQGDLRLWSGGGEQDPLCDPPEYRTLFDNNGFIFNTTGQAHSCDHQRLQTANCSHHIERPTTLPVSPTRDQLLTLLNPQSPGHIQLAAVLRPPPPPAPPLSLALLRAVELDAGAAERMLASPRGRFLRAATHLNGRLLDLDTETGALLHQGCLLRISFEELLTDTDYLLRQTRRLQQDLREVLYLNDLLWMLRGRLDYVSKRRWPFLAAHTDIVGDLNLVV